MLVLRRSMEPKLGGVKSLEILVIDIWEAFKYKSRTNRKFGRDTAYLSCKSTLELLFDEIIETQTITDIGRASKYKVLAFCIKILC